jgi:hypothetical protein
MDQHSKTHWERLKDVGSVGLQCNRGIKNHIENNGVVR